MKRLVVSPVILILARRGGVRGAEIADEHPHTGTETTIADRDGVGVLLPDAWRAAPAGRQLETGDMILSAQISPDDKAFAFTNSEYTHHTLHIVDLASEKEVATFPLDRSWSGLAWTPSGKRILVSGGRDNAADDIYAFQRWDDGSITRRRSVQLQAEKIEWPFLASRSHRTGHRPASNPKAST